MESLLVATGTKATQRMTVTVTVTVTVKSWRSLKTMRTSGNTHATLLALAIVAYANANPAFNMGAKNTAFKTAR